MTGYIGYVIINIKPIKQQTNMFFRNACLDNKILKILKYHKKSNNRTIGGK